MQHEARTLDVDALKCPKCVAPMVVLAFLTDPKVVRRIFTHLGLPSPSPPVAPARLPDDQLDLEFQDDTADLRLDDGETVPPDGNGRDPPDTQ